MGNLYSVLSLQLQGFNIIEEIDMERVKQDT